MLFIFFNGFPSMDFYEAEQNNDTVYTFLLLFLLWHFNMEPFSCSPNSLRGPSCPKKSILIGEIADFFESL